MYEPLGNKDMREVFEMCKAIISSAQVVVVVFKDIDDYRLSWNLGLAILHGTEIVIVAERNADIPEDLVALLTMPDCLVLVDEIPESQSPADMQQSVIMEISKAVRKLQEEGFIDPVFPDHGAVPPPPPNSQPRKRFEDGFGFFNSDN